jgi:predicted negative regulator of RcsB-dependent stress response
MDEDRSASGESVLRLREALTGEGDIGAALREVFHENSDFWTALATAALVLRFSPHAGNHDLPAFIERIAAAQAESGAAFPVAQALQLARAALGQIGADVDLEGFDPIETTQIMLAALFREWHPDAEEVAALFASATFSQAQAEQFTKWSADDMSAAIRALQADSGTNPALRARITAAGTPFVDAFRKTLSRTVELAAEQLAGQPDAQFELGRQLADMGATGEAQALWEQVVDSGDSEYAPQAALTIGKRRAEAGDQDGARAAYQKAAESDNPALAAQAALNLGMMLDRTNDTDGARAAYETAVGLEDPEWSPKAMLGLCNLLFKHGTSTEAIAALQQALDSGYAGLEPFAARSMALALKRAGNLKGARAYFERAITAGHPGEAALAASGLGLLLAEQGDLEGARAALTQAMNSGHPGAAMSAAWGLGELLARNGDIDGATAAFRWLIDAGDRQYSPRAAIRLGTMLQDAGDIRGAKSTFKRALKTGSPQVRRQAMQLLRNLPQPPLNRGTAPGRRR